MPLTLKELQDGVAYWTTSTPWPKDLHNAFYGRLGAENPNGDFDAAWWRACLRHLTAWRANRPLSKAELTGNFERERAELATTWQRCCAPLTDQDICDVSWEQVADWLTVVGRIKPTRSPVFTSKFAHFLLPAVFPVVDQAVMGRPFGSSYRAHFQGVQHEWETTPADVREELRAGLTAHIAEPPTQGYPVVTKITEVCLIGRARPRPV
jgi:hypothetical protein